MAIRLNEMSLMGPLAPDLLQVSHLQEVHLQNNMLTGEHVQAHSLPVAAVAAHSQLDVLSYMLLKNLALL